jgi:hypothetical protein
MRIRARRINADPTRKGAPGRRKGAVAEVK